MSRLRPAASNSLAVPVGLSAVLHTGIVATVLVFRAVPPPPMPPMYRVELIAAPAGDRAVGVVSNAPAPTVPTAPPPPTNTVAKSVTAAVAKPATKSVKPVATPSVAPATKSTTPPTPAPKAGGGPIGGTGADVASIRLEGIAFPFPGYLTNIERQIALNFTPRGNVGALRAEVFFMIRRDGSVAGFRFLTRSGNGAFDLECQGSIEAAGKSFGVLPAGFNDDVLPVIFSFDPSKLR